MPFFKHRLFQSTWHDLHKVKALTRSLRSPAISPSPTPCTHIFANILFDHYQNDCKVPILVAAMVYNLQGKWEPQVRRRAASTQLLVPTANRHAACESCTPTCSGPSRRTPSRSSSGPQRSLECLTSAPHNQSGTLFNPKTTLTPTLAPPPPGLLAPGARGGCRGRQDHQPRILREISGSS
jgi:hypothetical protein